MNHTVDQFWAAIDGQTTFTATVTPSDELIFLNRLKQRPGASYDYTVSGNNIVFTFPLDAGDTVEVVQ